MPEQKPHSSDPEIIDPRTPPGSEELSVRPLQAAADRVLGRNALSVGALTDSRETYAARSLESLHGPLRSRLSWSSLGCTGFCSIILTRRSRLSWTQARPL